MKKIRNIIVLILPIIAVGITILLYYNIADNGKQKKTEYPYFVNFLIVLVILYGVFLLTGFFAKNVKKKLIVKAPFYTGLVVFLCALNLITTKTTWLPTLYFPSLDRIFGLLWEEKSFLLSNIGSSLNFCPRGLLSVRSPDSLPECASATGSRWVTGLIR